MTVYLSNKVKMPYSCKILVFVVLCSSIYLDILTHFDNLTHPIHNVDIEKCDRLTY